MKLIFHHKREEQERGERGRVKGEGGRERTRGKRGGREEENTL